MGWISIAFDPVWNRGQRTDAGNGGRDSVSRKDAECAVGMEKAKESPGWQIESRTLDCATFKHARRTNDASNSPANLVAAFIRLAIFPSRVPRHALKY